jgi:hypothetical protein
MIDVEQPTTNSACMVELGAVDTSALLHTRGMMEEYA